MRYNEPLKYLTAIMMLRLMKRLHITLSPSMRNCMDVYLNKLLRMANKFADDYACVCIAGTD